MMKSPIAAFLAIGFACAAASAQMPTPAAPSAGSANASLRCFAELGERRGPVTYSLTYTGPKTKAGEPPAAIFTRVNGGLSANPAHGATAFPPGAYRFTLVRNGSGAPETISAKLDGGAMYSLLATLESDRPILRLVREYPLTKEEAPGIVIHNLMGQTPLALQVQGGQAVRVPPAGDQPYLLAANAIAGKPVTLTYLSERGLRRQRSVEYTGPDRLIAVFLRNGYGQTTVLTLPAKPEEEAVSLPTPNAPQGGGAP